MLRNGLYMDDEFTPVWRPRWGVWVVCGVMLALIVLVAWRILS